MEAYLGEILAALIGALVTLGGGLIAYFKNRDKVEAQKKVDMAELKASIEEDLWEKLQEDRDLAWDTVEKQREYIQDLETKIKELRKENTRIKNESCTCQ